MRRVKQPVNFFVPSLFINKVNADNVQFLITTAPLPENVKEVYLIRKKTYQFLQDSLSDDLLETLDLAKNFPIVANRKHVSHLTLSDSKTLYPYQMNASIRKVLPYAFNNSGIEPPTIHSRMNTPFVVTRFKRNGEGSPSLPRWTGNTLPAFENEIPVVKSDNRLIDMLSANKQSMLVSRYPLNEFQENSICILADETDLGTFALVRTGERKVMKAGELPDTVLLVNGLVLGESRSEPDEPLHCLPLQNQNLKTTQMYPPPRNL